MTDLTLTDLGWSDRLRDDAAGDTGSPARITSIARDRVEALASAGALTLTLPTGCTTGDYAVGDWVLYDPDTARITRRLDRLTTILRRAAGHDARPQLIAANVDTLGIVTACNADFNVARLERYLSLAAASGCLPLVILTRADEADDPAGYRRQAEGLSSLVTAITLDARDAGDVERLHPWCGPGQTLALLGSSGVGKTTLTNGLTGRAEATQDIRDDDAKGRHTTTARALFRTRAGGWLIDTPGMRELQLTDAADGIGSVFADLTDLAHACRFSDCTHEGEPGCAIAAAIADGTLDPARFHRWQKLLREDARNTESLAEAHARDRTRQKQYSQGRARSRAKRDI